MSSTTLPTEISAVNRVDEKLKRICETQASLSQGGEDTLIATLQEFGDSFLPGIAFEFSFKLSQDLNLVRAHSDIRVDIEYQRCRLTLSPQTLRWGFNPLFYGRVGTLVLLLAKLIKYDCNIVSSFIIDPSDGLSPLVVWNGKEFDYPSIAYSSYRPDSCLVADSFFVRSGGYAEFRDIELSSLPPWSERLNVAIWRGAAHGHKLYREQNTKLAPDWSWHQRLHLCAVSRLPHIKNFMDAAITTYNSLPEGVSREQLDTLEFKRLPIPKSDFARYKYIIDVDGFSNSWPGLFTALLTGACVLKIASAFGFKQWYYDRLVPWKNFVPVANDLEDLPERLEWVNTHDGMARQIGEAGRRLALSMSIDLELHVSVVGASTWLKRHAPTIPNLLRPGEQVPEVFKMAGATTVEQAVINAFYRKLLGREPDAEGLQGAIQNLRNVGLTHGIELELGKILCCDEFLSNHSFNT